jgi:hypothetical protein
MTTPRFFGAIAALLLAGCVVQSPIPEPEPDLALELKKLLAIFQQAVWKQEEYGEEVKRYRERTTEFVELHRQAMIETALRGKVEERPLAIAGLGFASGDWSLATLSNLVQDADPSIREAAIQALALLQIGGGRGPDRPTLDRIQAALDSIHSRETVQALFFFSTSPSYGSDEALLGRIEGKLDHRDREVRVQAARTLTIYRRPRSAAAFIRALQDGEPMVRINACSGLAAIQGADALSHILPLLQDPDPDVLAFAASLVAHLAPKGIVYRCPVDGTEASAASPCSLCGGATVPAPRK